MSNRTIVHSALLLEDPEEMANAKEHATLSARARVDHGVEVRARKWHVNRAADGGCVSRLVGLFDYVSVK